MKIKAWDKVKFRKDLEIGDYYGDIIWIEEMLPKESKSIVTKINSDGCFNVVGSFYAYTPEMVKKVYPSLIEIELKEEKSYIDVTSIYTIYADIKTLAREDEWRADWSDFDQIKCSIVYSFDFNKFTEQDTHSNFSPAIIYMSIYLSKKILTYLDEHAKDSYDINL